jgi:hypothetical protein
MVTDAKAGRRSARDESYPVIEMADRPPWFGSEGRAVSFRMVMGAPALSLEIKSAKRNRRRRGRSRRGCISGHIFRGTRQAFTIGRRNRLGKVEHK